MPSLMTLEDAHGSRGIPCYRRPATGAIDWYATYQPQPPGLGENAVSAWFMRQPVAVSAALAFIMPAVSCAY
mgnify:CR=1 FL=1